MSRYPLQKMKTPQQITVALKSTGQATKKLVSSIPVWNNSQASGGLVKPSVLPSKPTER